jgi:hypothetical protein
MQVLEVEQERLRRDLVVPDRGREGVAGQLDRLVVERAPIAVLAAGQRGLVELAVVVGAALQRLQRPLLPGLVQVSARS